MQADHSFWRTCSSQDARCHCDWRLTVYQCEETSTIRWIYIGNAIASAVVGVIAVGLLYYRLYYRGQRIFDTNTHTGFIRPKPIEAMILFAIIFNFLRLLHSIILVTDVLSNVTFRSFAFEFPWAFGYAALSSYVFGIAHTMSDSSHVIYNAWFHNPLKVDILCSLMIILPFISNNICSISAGVYAQQGNFEMATLYTHVLYYFWTIYCGTLALVLLYSGIHLIKLLKLHLKIEQQESRHNVAKVETGILKVRSVIYIGCACLLVFTIIVCLYGIFRERMLNSIICNLVIAGIWTFDGPLACIFLELALLLNPHMTGALGLVAVDSNFLTDLKNDTGTSSGQDQRSNPLTKLSTHKSALDNLSISYNSSSAQSVTSSSKQSPHHHHLFHRFQEAKSDDYSLPTTSTATSSHSYHHHNDSLDRYSTDTTTCLLPARPPASFQPATYTCHNQSQTSSAAARQLEQDQIQYNAITSQARIHHTRAPSTENQLLRHGPPSIPRTPDHLFTTYY